MFKKNPHKIDTLSKWWIISWCILP